MKLVVKALGITAVVSALNFLPFTGGVASASGPSRGVVVEHTHVSGDTVWGEGSGAETIDGCQVTYRRDLVGGKNEVAYSEVHNNLCTNSEAFFYGTAVPTVFDVAGNLATAHVVVEIPLKDALGQPTGSILKIDDTWTATGTPVRSRESGMYRIPPDLIYRYALSGITRDARVAGNVPLDSARIMRESRADMWITRAP